MVNMNDQQTTIQAVKDRVQTFIDQRDWQQFHDPKNLAEAISIEAGELLEQFLWLSSEESKCLPVEKLEKAKEEIADVLIFLVYMSDTMGINLVEEVERKIEANRKKYPVNRSKGSKKKYTDL